MPVNKPIKGCVTLLHTKSLCKPSREVKAINHEEILPYTVVGYLFLLHLFILLYLVQLIAPAACLAHMGAQLLL